MNTRTLKWRIPVVAAVIAACLYIVYPPFDPDGSGPKEGKLKLGLDLRGGMHLVLHVITDKLPVDERKTAASRAAEVIRNRIDQFGVSEPMIQQEGTDRLVVQLPGVTDRERALALLGRTAHLEFRFVAEQTGAEKPQDAVSFKRQEGGTVWLESRVWAEGKMLKNASQDLSHDFMEPVVHLSFNPEGAKLFGEATSQNVGRQLAIVLDDVVLSSPVIREPIMNGDAVISGSFTIDQARDLAIALKAGALPAPIEIQEERTVGPSLGKDSIEQGIRSTLWAGALVVVFMGIYYLLGGMLANLALVVNILIVGGLLAYFKGTLTLPGIAGVILTIGMAVDTNVLIMERIREELALGKSVAASIAAGYNKAFSAVFDTHITTMITAGVLFYFGNGPIRGFATTLLVGLLASFFSGLFVTRVLYDVLTSTFKFKNLHMLHIFPKVPNIPFLKIGNLLVVFSIILTLAGMFTIVTQSKNHLGVDFSGGTMQEYRFEKPIEAETLRKELGSVGLETATIQKVGNESDFIIRTPSNTEKKVESALQQSFKDNKFERVRLETVGPLVGQELRSKALLAVLVSLVLITIYVGFRFESRFAVAVIVSLFHDAIIATAAVLWTGRELSIPVLAAVLTVVGYSVNDTIIIFDRVRENNRRGLKMTQKEILNFSVNETLARTIMTTLTVLIVLVALYFWGGPVLNDFAFTMLVGVMSGVYSTIYIACPVVAAWSAKAKVKR